MSQKEEYYRRKEAQEGRRNEKASNRRWYKRFGKWLPEPNLIIQFLLVICTGGLIAIGYFQSLILNKTDQTLRAIQRPWISINLEITSDFTSDEKGAEIKFRYIFKNVGNSPALNVFGFARIEPNIRQSFPSLAATPMFHPDVQGELKAHCARITELTSRAPDDWFFGDIIYPGESIVTNDRATIDRSKEVTNPPDIPSWTLLMRPERKFTAPILITFCVDYQASLEPSHHQTAHAYYLTRKFADVPGGIAYVDPGEYETIPATELGLGAPTIYGNQYAN
jgi:hypothetical protein